MKKISKFVFAFYLILLTWGIMFKFGGHLSLPSVHIWYVNLIPYAQSGGSLEIAFNVFVFIPYGLLFMTVAKRLTFWQKFLIIMATSFIFEFIQFLTNIGVADITDLINNSIGGLLGLGIYQLLSKKIRSDKLDVSIPFVLILIILFLLILLSTMHLRFRF